MKYFEFTKLIKKGKESDKEFKNRAKKLNDEIIEFTLDYLIHTDEFITMERYQFEKPVIIPIDHMLFIEKIREKYRISLDNDKLPNLFEKICKKYPCLEIVKVDENRIDEAENGIFLDSFLEKVSDNMKITTLKINLDKLDEVVLFDKPKTGVVVYDDSKVISINIKKSPKACSPVKDVVKFGDDVLLLGETELYYKLPNGYIFKEFVR